MTNELWHRFFTLVLILFRNASVLRNYHLMPSVARREAVRKKILLYSSIGAIWQKPVDAEALEGEAHRSQHIPAKRRGG